MSTLSYTTAIGNNFQYYVPFLRNLFRKREPGLDLSGHVTLKGPHYIAIGEHADLWIGIFQNKEVAVKVLRGGSSNNQAFLDKFTRNLEREAKIWKTLSHLNVSKFYGLAFNFGYMPALILPFLGPNVVEYVAGKEDEVKIKMVDGIVQGLAYLHSVGVVHGDLRGANILMDADCPRICDYGLAFVIEPSEFTSIKTAGSCRWTSPEVMNPPDSDENFTDEEPLPIFTKESDMYAFAMTVIEVFTGAIPFNRKKNDSSVIFYVLADGRPDIPESLSKHDTLRDIVQTCWSREPVKRLSARAVIDKLKPHESEEAKQLSAQSQSKGWFRGWV